MEFGYSLAGVFVGFLVGLTGVGGGSLMAPLLILLFGFPPAVAVGTDLWFAAITKTAGGLVHHRIGSPDWRIFGWIALGSLPAASLTVLWLAAFHGGELESNFLLKLLGAVLLLTSILMMLKTRIVAPLRRMRMGIGPAVARLRRCQLILTIGGGAAVGGLVTLTSVGAGALVAVMLALIYPLRLDARTIVGTDILHAIPLTLIAAIGHSWLGNVDVWLLASLLFGSIPGIILGSLATGKVSENLVRYALCIMLFASAMKMLAS